MRSVRDFFSDLRDRGDHHIIERELRQIENKLDRVLRLLRDLPDGGDGEVVEPADRLRMDAILAKSANNAARLKALDAQTPAEVAPAKKKK